MRSSRFVSPSFSLSLSSLMHRTRKYLWIGLVIATAIHGILAQIKPGGVEHRTAKPLTTQFVKRKPRLTKPLELKKRPKPKRRALRRKMVAVKARVDRRGSVSGMLSTHTMDQWTKPRTTVGRMTSLQATSYEPRAMAEIIEGQMQAQNAVNMSLEMVDIEALDTGKYHAMVIQDPNDKRNIKGFFHIGAAYSESVARANERSAVSLPAAWAIRDLAGAMNRYTQIKTDVIGNYTFDSKELMKTPFTIASSHWGFDHTVSEAHNLGKYLTSGGFLVADARHPQTGPERPPIISFRRMIVHGLGMHGVKLNRDWVWERIPGSHQIYHCYFDFESIPPGVDNVVHANLDYLPLDYLEGITLGDQLVVVLSTKCYTAIWGVDGSSSWGRSRDNTRHLQFGVNLIIFALTQEGSITQQVMNLVE